MTISVIFTGSNFFAIEIGHKQYYFSYETCVAIANLETYKFIRRESNYSKTTAKHMKKMGVSNWTKVPDSEFEQSI